MANCQIQEQFLLNSSNPVHDARMHAMLCYRTPESFNSRFQRSKNKELTLFNVENWLLHHGDILQKRFQLSAYKLMNQLLRTIDVTKGSGLQGNILDIIQSKITIIGVDSDLFFTAEENRETQKQLALTHPNVTYNEINSIHGHDAFFIEFSQLEKIIENIFNAKSKLKKLKILKFGGKSLANGEGLKTVISIIESKLKNNENIAVVVSARGKSTDELEEILEKAATNICYKEQLKAFKEYQNGELNINFTREFARLEDLFEGVQLLGDYSRKIKDEVLSQGEIISAKLISSILKSKGINANITDTRTLIKTDDTYGNAKPIEALSKKNVIEYFKQNNGTSVNIVTGFIASNIINNKTTTLGRNGSNYTASLLANYLDAEELQNLMFMDLYC